MKFNNQYYLLRHGEAYSNKNKIFSCYSETFNNPLTEYGKKQINAIALKLKKEKIDLIYASDLLRTKQTAEIVAKKSKLKVIFDKRLREINFGIFNNQTEDGWVCFFKKGKDRYIKRPKNGENFRDVRKRALESLKSIDRKYIGKKILIVSHGGILFELCGIMENLSEIERIKNRKKLLFKKGELRKL
jgi:broad specificity phosphatase PhoE